MLRSLFPSRRSTVSFAGIILLLSAAVYGQKTEWRPISPAELQMTKPVVEPDADAEALIWETSIDDSDSKKLIRKNYVRVKIFNERGRERFAKFDIPYIKGYSEIKDIAAHIIKPDGSTIELADSDIFEREVVKVSKLKVRSKAFAVPNIVPGVIVEYQFTEQIKYGGLAGSKLELQKDIPVQNLVYLVKPYRGAHLTAKYYNASINGDGFKNDRDGFYRLIRHNIPAFKEENFMPPEAMVRPYVIMAVSGSFGVDVFDPAMYWRRLGFAGADMVRAMHGLRKDVDKLTEGLIAGAATPEERLRRIYDFCQHKIRNTSFDPAARNSQETWRDVFDQNWKDIAKNGSGSGSSATINVLFGAMATAAGFDTRWVYASRRDEVFMNPKMTDSSLMRFAGIGIVLGGKRLLYDPGNKFAPFGQLSWYREDALGLFVSEDSLAWTKIPLSTADTNLTKRTAKFRLGEDGTLEGTVSIELYGNEALNYRMNSYDDDPTARQNAIKDAVLRRITNAEVSKITIENFDDNSKPLIERYSIKVPNYAQKTGKRMFFQPGYFEYGSPPPFPNATRVHDIFFSFPWSERDEITIEFPPTFAIESPEAPQAVSDKAGSVSDKITIEANTAASKVIYSRDLSVGMDGKTLYKVAEYSSVKEVWDAVQKADTAALTLKMKE